MLPPIFSLDLQTCCTGIFHITLALTYLDLHALLTGPAVSIYLENIKVIDETPIPSHH